MKVQENATPAMTYTNFIVPKRNGSATYKNRYENKEITVVIEVTGDGPIALAKNETNLLMKWVGVKGKLIFSKRPNLYYEAEILESIVREETTIGTTNLTITFKCSPFMYELSYDDTDFSDELPTRFTFKGPLTHTTIQNYGNYEAQPVLELSGIGPTSITIDKVTCSFNLQNETVYINTEKMIVYKLVDGKKVNRMIDFIGQFPVVPSGESTAKISGNATIKLKYRNTYIV